MDALKKRSVSDVENVFKCGFFFEKFAGFEVWKAKIRVKFKSGKELKVALVRK